MLLSAGAWNHGEEWYLLLSGTTLGHLITCCSHGPPWDTRLPVAVADHPGTPDYLLLSRTTLGHPITCCSRGPLWDTRSDGPPRDTQLPVALTDHPGTPILIDHPGKPDYLLLSRTTPGH